MALAAAAGGIVNSIAGGGTLLTFPSLVALGVPPLVANATSTVALWPGALSSMFGYRGRLRGYERWALVFAVPSLAGGALGAWLLLSTPEARFERIVPWLVFGATLLFALQGPVMRRLRPGRTVEGEESGGFIPRHGAIALLCQFLVGVYGGYFGAGIGILMLAVLGYMGFSDVHRMNGLKNWGGLCMNFVAAAMFAVSGIVDWAVALSMAVGATAGGYLAARVAQRVPQAAVRRAIIGVGVAAGLWLWWAPLS
ncbi:MAG TPA: sulfite exporter TauE/SafE family protein [Vicinamibacterales bacterium]|nr:sulfite exporter TauE/SafE family protein [Vicinamibacterales bacterium]